MKKPILFLAILIAIVIMAIMPRMTNSTVTNSFEPSAVALQSPAIEFNKTYVLGSASSIIKSTDGGYVIAGTVNSTGLNYSGQIGNASLVKTDSSGNIEWTRTYSRVGLNDVTYSVIQTNDGGYMIVGSTMTASFGISSINPN